jgi:hypothetical protein
MSDSEVIQALVRADRVKVGDRVKRGANYLRKVVAVERDGDSVAITVDRGFGDTVVESYGAADQLVLYFVCVG